ncbi:IS5 family transposase [Noviherbaspirillum sedimenti]|uniref:IS5 family transposase n=1 Tax=Noviherbaspirillum sedimenti TaxID=2320865 RepID=UPI0018B38764|nr:IS5 family transposase [Noviherbaspirillum sedimenti]
MRKRYASDISREAFEKLEPILMSARKTTKPRRVDLYEVFCAILYLLKSSCQWDMLPSDFPKKSTVYYYFQLWKDKPGEDELSLLEQALKNAVGGARVNSERSANMTFVIVDAQSVKNADTAKHKGDDAGKKVSGIKRHIAVDTQGFPHAIAVTTADVTDRKGALQAFSSHRKSLSRVVNVLVDGGYTGQPFADGVRDTVGASVEIAKRSALHTFAVMPKRWAVERSFAWLEKCRRLWKNCERQLNTSLQFVNLAFLVLLMKRTNPET